MHAKAVLFVDDGKSEIAEHDILGKNRMRADENVDVARFEGRQRGGAREPAFPSREQRKPNPRRLRHRLECRHMLTREDFGRRHECALAFSLNRVEQRCHGDHGLS